MKPAAIWARVSTPDQRELSPDSQEAAVRQVLEAQGYTVADEHIIKVDWTSMDLMVCSDFQRLRRWIGNGEIEALGVLDRDRLRHAGPSAWRHSVSDRPGLRSMLSYPVAVR